MSNLPINIRSVKRCSLLLDWLQQQRDLEWFRANRRQTLAMGFTLHLYGGNFIMANCERLNKCPFFRDKLSFMPKTAATMKQIYCHGEKTGCGRYMVASHGLLIPSDLFPNDYERALKILDSKNR
jgi:hypothetical protein